MNKDLKKQEEGIAEPLVKMLNHIHPISKEIIAYFNKHTFLCSTRKGKLLLKSGTVCSYLYFIKKGVLRGFAKEGNKEMTTWITAENGLVTSITSFDQQTPARENIQALENCELLAMSFDDFQKLYIKHPEFNIVGRKLLQQYYRDAEDRAYIARLTKAEYRYNYFLQMHETLANRLPLKYIASYLAITLETLSRIRNKKASSPATQKK